MFEPGQELLEKVISLVDGAGALQRGASTIDDTKEYRYTLERTWNPDVARVLFVMLNPSTADANFDDATIRRCLTFAARWGHLGIVVGDLFALRSTDPKGLLDHRDPVGPENNDHLQRLAGACKAVVAAWGNSTSALRLFQDRQTYVKELLRSRMQCLGTNKDGTPKHPVRLAGDARLQSYGG